MAKYLVISDVHNRTTLAERICEKYGQEYIIIFLGDYFDYFHDGRYDAEKTARWLKHSLQQPNRIHLFGNHDAAYMFCYNKALLCPGWDEEKNRAVRSVLDESDFDQLKLYHYIEEGNWLLSHAGFTLPNVYGFRHPELLNKGCKYDFLVNTSKENVLETIEKETVKFFEAAKNNGYHHFMFQGSGMGEFGNGGPFWLRPSSMRMMKQFNQIVGHTTFNNPQVIYLPNKTDKVAEFWILDTDSQHVMFLEDGVARPASVESI